MQIRINRVHRRKGTLKQPNPSAVYWLTLGTNLGELSVEKQDEGKHSLF